MLKHFYQSPNGYFRLGTIPGGYPPGTHPGHIEHHFADPDEYDDRAQRRREAEEDKADEERKLRRLNKGRWDTRFRRADGGTSYTSPTIHRRAVGGTSYTSPTNHSAHFGANHTNNNERKQMSKLQFKYPKRDDIPAEHVSLYIEVQDGWQLDAHGAADAAAIENLQTRLSQAETEMNQKKEQYETATATHLNERKKFEERIAQLETNRGSGAAPPVNTPPASTGPKNPFSEENFNLTKQAELVRHNPEEAARLQAQAKH